MTVEKQIQDKIYELINNVNKTIPVDWDELYINSEMSETGGNVYFFFKVADNDNLFYSLLIPDDFKVDEKTFEKMDYQNYVLARELWKIFENNHIEVWKNASFIYKNNKLSSHFDYVDWNASQFGPTDRMNYFRYKYMKVAPKDNIQEQLFQKMEKYQSEFL